MTPLTDPDAFYTEHEGCGELDGGVDDHSVFWMTCTCGARIARQDSESER